jgi:hypothetical protein
VGSDAYECLDASCAGSTFWAGRRTTRVATLEAILHCMLRIFRKRRILLVYVLAFIFEKKTAEWSDVHHGDDFEKNGGGRVICITWREGRCTDGVNFAKR